MDRYKLRFFSEGILNINWAYLVIDPNQFRAKRGDCVVRAIREGSEINEPAVYSEPMDLATLESYLEKNAAQLGKSINRCVGLQLEGGPTNPEIILFKNLIPIHS